MLTGFLASLALIVAGAFALRTAWAGETPLRPWLIAGGWLAFIGGTLAMAWGMGAEVGPPAACLVLSLAGLSLVALNLERRASRQSRTRTPINPSQRPNRLWRGAIRIVLAGPLSGAAALLTGIALAKHLPMQDVDAIAVGGLTAPLLWAAGMAWTLSDDRILRALAVLSAVTAAGYAFSFL